MLVNYWVFYLKMRREKLNIIITTSVTKEKQERKKTTYEKRPREKRLMRPLMDRGPSNR